jgi:hypothetical protein
LILACRVVLRTIFAELRTILPCRMKLIHCPGIKCTYVARLKKFSLQKQMS